VDFRRSGGRRRRTRKRAGAPTQEYGLQAQSGAQVDSFHTCSFLYPDFFLVALKTCDIAFFCFSKEQARRIDTGKNAK
jgi:hypothetical protein